MHLVDHIDLEPANGRCKLGLLEQLLDLTHASIRGSINLDVINEPAAINLSTTAADAAWGGRDALLTVQRLGQNSGKGCLSCSAGAS